MMTVKGRWIVLSAFVLVMAVSSYRARASDIRLQEAARVNLATASLGGEDVVKDPAQILGAARVIYVCSRTAFLKTEVLENELLKRVEFRQSGLLITKNAIAADLVITIRRANFTTVYPYDVVDAKTKLVVATGKVNSLFGSAAGKIAKEFMKKVNDARAPASAKPKK